MLGAEGEKPSLGHDIAPAKAVVSVVEPHAAAETHLSASEIQSKGLPPNVMRVIASVVDVFIASLTPEETNQLVSTYAKTVSGPSPTPADVLTQFATLKASDLNAAEEIAQLFLNVAPKAQLKQLTDALGLLSTSFGTWLLCRGSYLPGKAFPDLPRDAQEKALQSLGRSRMASFRVLFAALKNATGKVVYGKLVYDENGKVRNPTHAAMGHPGPYPEKERPPAEKFWTPPLLDVEGLAAERGLDATETVELECDVVIVGSGAGGGLIAAELAKAGHKVIVMEKAVFTNPADYILIEEFAMNKLYESQGALTTETGSMNMFAGSSVGGGTTVNWSGSLRLPHTVRKEWATKFNLPVFLSREYAKSFDAIESRLGVSTEHIQHNAANQVVLDGCKELGFPVGPIPQNTAGQTHSCGWCIFGCPYGEKQSSYMTYLKDAADHGMQLIDGAFVEKVIVERGVAKGVLATVGSSKRKVVVKSKKVVAACGGLHTAPLLLRSGLRNRHVGRNLRLHPATIVVGIFPERLVKPFHGSIMTTLSSAADNIDGTGYGVKIEVPSFPPVMYSAVMPWHSALDHKRLMTLMDRASPVLVLLRDEDSEGRVWSDEEHKLRIDWNMSKTDRVRIAKGVQAAIDILIAAGASEIITPQQSVAPLKLENVTDNPRPFESDEYQKYCAMVQKKKEELSIFGAHQMGSCRMAGSSALGACKPDGETWEVKGLYVGDASLFPTASGVNPMITVYSMANIVAQGMKHKMASERETKATAAVPAKL
ncbi:hypothetical protein HK104_006945 [Borealophlyctis nickersoniae]|nr:hypothetical protein HK104_006945 [Borealophlyctis nickersoniae]